MLSGRIIIILWHQTIRMKKVSRTGTARSGSTRRAQSVGVPSNLLGRTILPGIEYCKVTGRNTFFERVYPQKSRFLRSPNVRRVGKCCAYRRASQSKAQHPTLTKKLVWPGIILFTTVAPKSNLLVVIRINCLTIRQISLPFGDFVNVSR